MSDLATCDRLLPFFGAVLAHNTIHVEALTERSYSGVNIRWARQQRHLLHLHLSFQAPLLLAIQSCQGQLEVTSKVRGDEHR